MVKVELGSVFVEDTGKELLAHFTASDGKRRYAMVALRLRDLQQDAVMSEWFYLVACSQGYIDKPLKVGPKFNETYTVVQDDFDVEAIRNEAALRLGEISAKNWDEFYA